MKDEYNPKGKGTIKKWVIHIEEHKHTHETCFKLHGYPEWWNELKARKQSEANANSKLVRASFLNAKPHLSFIPQVESLSDLTILDN